jgi:predicted nucleic-acid-binding Zn-ribbon protein
MASDFKCSKCRGEMQEGLVVDLNYAGILQSMWVEDQAGKSVGPVATGGKRKVKTITYRCSSCGYLDSYAK